MRSLTIEQAVKDLFASEWQDLHECPLQDDPGVYLLAYTTESLLGNKVSAEVVFYVGMTHDGLSKRLRTFKRAIETGEAPHSAGKRFFREWTKGVGYERMRNKKPFFVASVPIPCNTEKSSRSPGDLRTMGIVAAVKFYSLAHVLEETKEEPELNKK